MTCSKSSRQTKDFISNVPDLITDKILEHLPINVAARTSVLSKQWRRTWLSIKSLVFDSEFWREQFNKDESFDWQKFSNIVNSVLLLHSGPIHNFYLFIPENKRGDCTNHGQWLSFLSKNMVRKIVMRSPYEYLDIACHIFLCSNVVQLVLEGFNLNSPPVGFSGYQNLKHLELFDIDFAEENIFYGMITNCSMLASLTLESWSGMDHIVIDIPSLETLVLRGKLTSLAFKNVSSLKNVSVCLEDMPDEIVIIEKIDAANLLPSSSELQTIEFNGQMCEFLVAGGIIRSLPTTFNHLHKLGLNYLDFSYYGVFHCVLGIIESCPNIKMLDLSGVSENNDEEPELDYNFSHKLDHLREIQIKRIKGSRAELKLIEYLLAISTVLETLFFMFTCLDSMSELKLSRVLMGFPRASSKARLVCLDDVE